MKIINTWTFYLMIKKCWKNILKYGIKIKVYLKIEFDSDPVHYAKYIKTKIKIYNDRVYTNFQYNKIPKDSEYCTCLSVIFYFYSIFKILFLLIQMKNIIHKYF